MTNTVLREPSELMERANRYAHDLSLPITVMQTFADLIERLTPTPEPSPEELSYRWAHEDAVEMGYPSLTEALEHLSELRASLTPEPSLREALASVCRKFAAAWCALDFAHSEGFEWPTDPLGEEALAFADPTIVPEYAALSASPTLEPCRLREALVEARDEVSLIADGWKFDDASVRLQTVRERARKALEIIDSVLSASPAEPQEATEAMIEAIKGAAFDCTQPISRRTAAAIYTALRSAASGGDTV